MKRVVFVMFTVIASFKLMAQDISYAKEVVKALASPEFKGRGYVEDGNRIAAKYIQAQYVSIGLKPMAKEFFQPFKIEVNTFPGTMELQLDTTKLVAGKDFIIDPLSAGIKGEFSVYTIKRRDLLNESMVGKAVRYSEGKFLVIDERNTSTESKEDKAKLDDIQSALMYSPQLSHAGTIIITDKKLDWSTAPQQAGKAVFTVNSAYDISTLLKVKVSADASLINYKTQNIVGYVPGREQPDSFLVVLAHYDHLGKMGDKVYFPGANDNASGVAMLLNLAKYYKANPHRYSVVFIALGAEEIGIMGAKHFVDNPLFDLKRIKFLVNFDLAGTGEEGIKVVNGSVYRDKFDQLVKYNEANNYLNSVQIRGAACNSDHCLFYQKGVPSFYIYTLGGIKAYHDIYDKWETLPLTEFEDYTKLMIEFYNGIN